MTEVLLSGGPSPARRTVAPRAGARRTVAPRAGARRDVGWLMVIVYTAILVRVYPAFKNVFGGPAVAFQGNDAWYHMRLIDHLAANFPRRLTFDPYALFPAGQEVTVAPLLDLVIAGVAWALGLGAPSERLVEIVAAWTPPILGGLTVLPVYGIGRRLLDRRAGLFAAGLLAVQPGQFLLRSVLGFVDHHVMEALLSAVTVWLTLIAIEAARSGRGGPTWRAAGWAGLALGGYLLNWGSGSLFVAVLVLWLVVQATCDFFRGRSILPLAAVALPMALVAGIVLLPFARVLPGFRLHAAALAGLAAVPCVLLGLAWIVHRSGLPRPVFVLLLMAGAVSGWWLLHELWPAVASQILVSVGRFLPSEVGQTVSEAQPLLGSAEKPLEEVWKQYRAAFALGLVGLAVLIWRVARRPAAQIGTQAGAQAGDLLLPVWSLAMFAATLGQNRFGYYLDINLCLLIGLLCGLILGSPSSSTAAKRSRGRRLLRAMGAGVVALVAFLPTLKPVIEIARSPRGPGFEWWAALSWLRANSPEPFGDAEAYLALPSHQPSAGSAYAPASAASFGPSAPRRTESTTASLQDANSLQLQAPPPSRDEAGEKKGLAPTITPAAADQGYGVMAWWDYGYWITRIGRRPPVANPTQAGAGTAARFFLATDEASAMGILQETGARYVIANFDLTLWLDPTGGHYGLFDAMVPWSGEDRSRFYEVVWSPGAAGELTPVYVFYPDFYRTMAVRLHHFAGDAVESRHSSFVVALEERANAEGVVQKVLMETHPFETYEEAKAFLAQEADGADDRYRLVGRDPHYPCLPLESLEELRQVYQFPSEEALGPQVVPQIRVLEFVPAEAPVSAPY